MSSSKTYKIKKRFAYSYILEFCNNVVIILFLCKKTCYICLNKRV